MTGPPIDVRLELDTELEPFATVLEASAFAGHASLALLDVADRLGIPVDPVVSVDTFGAPKAVRLRIDGTPVSYPPELLTRTWLGVVSNEAAAAPYVQVEPESSFPDRWLARMAHEQAPVEGLSLFFERLVASIAALRPSLLFGMAQGDAYVAEAGVDPEIVPLLRSLLDAGISLADHQQVREALADADVWGSDETAEVVRARLMCQRIGVEAHSHYIQELRRLLPPDAETLERAIAPDVGLFAEDLGIVLPETTVRSPHPTVARANMLLDSEFRVFVGSRESLPIRGLESGELLVIAAPDELAEVGIAGRSSWIPGSNRPGAVVSGEHGETLSGAGYTTLDALQLAQLAVMAEIRSSAHLLVTSDGVYHHLVRLADRKPRLAGLLGTGYEVALRLAPTLRALVREDVSIRDLDAILTELVLVEDPAGQGSETARRAVAPATSRQNMLGVTIIAYLLDRELVEAATRAAEGNGAVEEEAIRSAVWRELSYLPPVAHRPLILTDSNSRALIRRVLEPEFPDLPILSYRDLPPDVNVQPIARIRLSSD